MSDNTWPVEHLIKRVIILRDEAAEQLKEHYWNVSDISYFAGTLGALDQVLRILKEYE